MPKKSSIKPVVDGLPIREYLLKCLVNKSYRTLLTDNNFKIKTGIKSLGNFYNQAEKYGINMQEIYKYGVAHGLILEGATFEDWTLKTRKNFGIPKSKTQRDMLFTIGEELGLYFAETSSEEIVRLTLLDFISEDELTTRLNGKVE